jgi:hypothetical protein
MYLQEKRKEASIVSGWCRCRCSKAGTEMNLLAELPDKQWHFLMLCSMFGTWRRGQQPACACGHQHWTCHDERAQCTVWADTPSRQYCTITLYRTLHLGMHRCMRVRRDINTFTAYLHTVAVQQNMLLPTSNYCTCTAPCMTSHIMSPTCNHG